MQRLLILFFLLISVQNSYSYTVKVIYEAPGAYEAKMIWGVNDWNKVDSVLPGTIVHQNVMHTVLKRAGNTFTAEIFIPDSCVLDYIFEFSKIQGPFRENFKYFDLNNQKHYHRLVHNNAEIMHAAVADLKPVKAVSLFRYSAVIFVFCSVLALAMWGWQRNRKKHIAQIQPFRLLLSLSFALALILILVRALLTEDAVQILLSPLAAIPQMFRSASHDIVYVIIITVAAVAAMLAVTRRRMTIVWIFAGVAAFSVLVALVNTKVTAMLGRPFSYQWLYYSGFLNSSDATEAIRANLNLKTAVSYLLVIVSLFPLTWFTYRLMITKPVAVLIAIAAFACAGIFAGKSPLKYEFRANPVVYFVSSLFSRDNIMMQSSKNLDLSEFTVKNENSMHPDYAEKFRTANIKNVIIVVLESVPAEFVTLYNPVYKTTPFLDSIRNSTAVFSSVYAHVPATNKSMVSVLCGMYPYLSFRSVTYEKPGIGWPSITSELNNMGYRTAFFNSGDNRFQGAENFLKARGFDLITDFRQNSCSQDNFSDSRFTGESLDGTRDSCLAVNFFKWLGNDNHTPFFSMMWTYQTHYPYFPTGKKTDFKTGNFSQEKYLNALRNADQTIRMLVEGLKDRKLDSPTLLVILGDHGEAFGKHNQVGHAGGIYEENLHIPFILVNPMVFSGETIHVAGGISDIAPTVLSILQQPVPEVWQGENLFSIHRRKRVYLFSPFSDYLFGFREGKYKFIYNATTGKHFLYDLENDPSELNDISANHTEYVEQAKKHLSAWVHYQQEFIKPYMK